MDGGRKRDVVIVGGSFAGLATAHFTGEGDVLILERQKELGKTQKSTCCTSVNWMEKLGCEKSILHSFDYVTIHSSKGAKAKIRLPETFCTIDYKIFCNTLAGGLKNSEVLTGRKAIGLSENMVQTEEGPIAGKIVVDASGWPGIRAKKGDQKKGKKPAFGLEIETKYKGDSDSFHIYYGKRYIDKGYGWVFPTSYDRARIGIGGYSINKPVEGLDHFLKELGVDRSGLKPHGGYLPLFGLDKPFREKIFVVGDAGNHVLPTSGEGIRKAFEYGELCGGIIKKILSDEMDLNHGLTAYYKVVMGSERFYRNLRFVQTLATYCPDFARNRIVETISKSNRAESILHRYVSDEINSPRTRILKTVLGGIIS